MGDTNVENVEQVVQAAAPVLIKTVSHEEASDLPEINWLWRRVYIFAVTSALLGLVYWIVGETTTDQGTIRMVAQYALILVGLAMLLYVAGASSEAITRLVGAIKTTTKETVTTAPPPP